MLGIGKHKILMVIIQKTNSFKLTLIFNLKMLCAGLNTLLLPNALLLS